MFFYIMNNKYRLAFLFVIIIAFFVPFLSIQNGIKYEYIGAGDYLSPINLESLFYNNFFIYRPFTYGGFNTGFVIPKLFPEVFFFFFLNKVGLSFLISTLLYISSILVVACVSMFYYLNYIFTYRLNFSSDRKYFFSIVGSVLYTFSTNFIATIIPGHFPQLMVYAFLPLVLLVFDKTLHGKKIKFVDFLKYFAIFLTCASAFGNIAFIYVLMLTFGMYSLFSMIIEKTKIFSVIKSLSILLLALISSNVFWILSFVNSLMQLTNLSSETLQDLDNSVLLSVSKASVLNILFGKAEWQLYLMNTSYYINIFYLIFFILISIFFIIAIIKYEKNRFVLLSLSMTLFSIFIAKGPREPFGNIFMWLYHNLFGFQVFRRPISKYHAIFLLFYFTLSLVGIMISTIKFSKKKFSLFVVTPISLILFYIVIIFIKTFTLTPFNIPSYYNDANKYLIADKVRKVLILPGIHGLQPTYDNSINNLYASDMLSSIWYFPFDTPVDASFATDYQKKIINPIMSKIKEGEDICDLTKKAGISHIMLRHDLSADNPFEDMPKNLSIILNRNRLLKEKKDFYNHEGKGFTIYKVDSKCLSNLIQISGATNTSVDYQIINPVKIKIFIKGLRDKRVLTFLNNFQQTWKLYISKYNDVFFLKNEPLSTNTYPKIPTLIEGDEFKYLFEKPLFNESHKISKNWVNQWTVDSESISKHYQGYYQKNPDGSINVQLILYFESQNYFYIGALVFGIILIMIVMILIIQILSRRPHP